VAEVTPVKLTPLLGYMDYLQHFRKLSDIERAVGVLDSISFRRMIIATQKYILDSLSS
jgi:hypothetical protein